MKHLLFLAFLCLSILTFGKIHVVTVGQGGYRFDPSSINVLVGDTVRFVYVSGYHTTTSFNVPLGAESWDANMQSDGDVFDYVVKVPGLYNYKCLPHDQFMFGSFEAKDFVNSLETNLSDNSALRIVSNPIQGILQLSFPDSRERTIDIYDLKGIEIQKLSGIIATQLHSVDVSYLPNGMYVLICFSPSGKSAVRILKE